MTTKKTFDESKLIQVKSLFSELPPVQKTVGYTQVELVQSMATEIKAAQEKGYTLAMILDMLKDNEITIGLSTLKKVLAEADEKAKAKARPKSPRSAKKSVQKDLLDDTEKTDFAQTKSTEKAKDESDTEAKDKPPVRKDTGKF